jgi:hypothetical protein
MNKDFALVIDGWAAAFVDDEGNILRRLGACVEEARIPAKLRRRMGPMERLMAQCALGVLRDLPGAEIILCSRYGNVDTLASLLGSIAKREPLSPMAFSLAVHNAAAGLLGQMRGDRAAHTALAAGRETLLAGLIDGYARLATDCERPIALVFGDWPLPDIYRRFVDLECGGTAMACLLRRRTPASNTTPTLRPLPDAAKAERIEGAELLARRLALALESGTDLAFRGQSGPAWKLAGG